MNYTLRAIKVRSSLLSYKTKTLRGDLISRLDKMINKSKYISKQPAATTNGYERR